MRKILTPQILLLAIFTMACSSTISAQQQPRPASSVQTEPAEAGRQRPNLLEELGLSQDQIDAVRLINQERKPVEMAARQRFQEASRALNMSIYGDSVDEVVFQRKLRDFQAAQAELARIKFTNELAVRQVLTPDQLIKFRELRRRFAEGRGRGVEGPPFRRMRRGMRGRPN